MKITFEDFELIVTDLPALIGTPLETKAANTLRQNVLNRQQGAFFRKFAQEYPAKVPTELEKMTKKLTELYNNTSALFWMSANSKDINDLAKVANNKAAG